MVPDKIPELVERFLRNLDAYKRSAYNETQVRREFLDPFFKALGWDVDNEQGYAEAYKDVIHEDAIKIAGHSRAPDYSFRIGGVRKFFVEAKKPAINLRDDADGAYQLRRYAWSAKLPLSILSNFEELAVYDCRVKPDKADKASHSRVLSLKYTDYRERWEEIDGIFSREAILKGSFDKYAESNKAKKGTTEVDAAFLAEIERWRELLARNLALRNPSLTPRELNYAVQLTIDRIIFLRICEDRGIEPYGRLMALQNGDRVYKRLFEWFNRADIRYNSGLFHFKTEKGRGSPVDSLTPKLTIDDKILKDIFKNLYYPDSPYEFSVLPVDLLGQVYEQFLGKVIRLTAGHRAVVEYKPEVRKAGGVYYTPTYIVDYIVRQTVGQMLEGRKSGPRSGAGRLKILDPACGSGSFLLGAYQFLLDWHLKAYMEDDPHKWASGRNPRLYPTAGGSWKLTINDRKRLLLEHIYGVDIDSQAVEVTKLSLLLKILEGEDEQSVGQESMFHRVLPDLGDNIKCGNSLIGPDYYRGRQLNLTDDEETYRINAFDWQAEFPEIMAAGGFDAVIGNPPYDVMEKERGESSWPHTALIDYVKLNKEYEPALGGKLNLFRFFLVRSMCLLRPNCRFGMIVPLSLLADISCSRIRHYLLSSMREIIADCFPQKDNPNRRVFLGAKLSTVIFSGKKKIEGPENDPEIKVRVFPWNSFEDKPRENIINLTDLALVDPINYPVPLVDYENWGLCRKIHTALKINRLGEVEDFSIHRGEINQTIFRQFVTDNHNDARLLKGVEIGRYHIRKNLSQGNREWFNEKNFLRTNQRKNIVEYQRIATQRITGVDEHLRIVCTLINPVTYFADSTNSVCLNNPTMYRLEYLLGLLNSYLFQWRFKITSTNNNVATNELNSMPFRTIDFNDPTDKALHDRMVEMVENMLAWHKQLPAVRLPQEEAALQRRIAETDRRIDELVYELYELTPEEIRLVEGVNVPQTQFDNEN